MAAPERSLKETLASEGIAISGGERPQVSTVSFINIDPEVKLLHNDLANELIRVGQAEFSLDKSGILFLTEQGVGTEFVFKFNRLREDGRPVLANGVVHPDTDPVGVHGPQLRIAVLAGDGLWIPDKVDPYNKRINPQDVEMRTGNITTLGRGGHIGGMPVGVSQPVHVVPVLSLAGFPESDAAVSIRRLPDDKQAHAGDILQGPGQKGLPGAVAASNSEKAQKSLDDVPTTAFPPFYANNPPPNPESFKIVINKEMVEDPAALLKGEVKLKRRDNPNAVIEDQEYKFARLIRQGPQAVEVFMSVVEPRKITGWKI